MGKHFNFNSKEELLAHLREVRQRKEKWQKKAIDEYQKLMQDTEKERKRIHAAVVD
jgi:hypothetical protein